MQLTAPLGAAQHGMEAAPRARPSASTGAAADPGCSTDEVAHAPAGTANGSCCYGAQAL